MRRVLMFLASLVLVAGPLAPSPALAVPKPTDVMIRNVKVGGPGCPQGTTAVLVTSTTPGGPADFFEVIYDAFSVQKGPGVPISEERKDCTIAVDLLIPNGFRFTLTDVHYEGYADLSRGSTGILDTQYFFPFFSNRVSASRVLTGPFNGDYHRDDTVGLFSTIWSPCGMSVPLNMKSTLSLRGPLSDPGLMTVDLTTGKLTQIWAIQWATCP